VEEGGFKEQLARVRGRGETVAEVILIVVIAGMALWALWAGRSRSAGRPGSASLKNAVQALATNPSQFVRSRLTGGVGAVLAIDPAVGLPTVMGILAGSPADRAGLHTGDVVTQINGATTTGQKLAAVVEAMRGFSAGRVAITVLRGQTNRSRLEFVIRRNSMNTLLQLPNSPRLGTNSPPLGTNFLR
jgi:membrane-associated protease RseP (regulator of RpoE activity)